MIYPDFINGVIDSNVSWTIIISAGQSNTMTGPGLGASDVQTNNVWQLNRSPNNYATIGQDPISHPNGILAGNIGHDARLGKLIKTNDLSYTQHVLILGQGVAGTSFTNNEWGVGNSLYTGLKSRLTYVLDRITNIDKIIFSWHQGETDVTNAMSEATYKAEFDAQYDDFLSFVDGYGIARSKIKLLVGQMLPAFITTYGTDGTAIDNAHQDTPNRYTYTAFASATTPSTITDSNDGVHYNAVGQRTLADRYYTALNTI